MPIEKQREVVSHEVVLNSAEHWAHKLREDARVARLNGDTDAAIRFEAQATVTISALQAVREARR